MITKTQRWLDLIAFLVKRHFPVPVEDVMEGVPAYREKWRSESEKDRGAVRRMFERDKDELRALGMPLETVQYSIEYGLETAEGYRLSSRDFYLPYLRVVGSEGGGGGGTGRGAAGGGTAGGGAAGGGAVEVDRDSAAAAVDALERVAELPAFALAEDARSALRKVSFDLDVGGLGGAPVLYVEADDPGPLRERVALLMDAVRDRKKASFRYHGIYRGEPTDRTVAGYGLLFQHGHWYLVGHDDLRDAMRVFRLDRMEEVTVNPRAKKTPDYEIPDDFDLSGYAARAPWELGSDDEVPLRARVRFEFPESLWAGRNEQGELVEELEGGAALREFGVRQVDPFLRWLQGFGGDAVVIEPPELRDEQAALARRTAALYGEEA